MGGVTEETKMKTLAGVTRRMELLLTEKGKTAVEIRACV